MTEFEQSVLKALLEGDHPILAALREQVPVTLVERRDFSGVGFFTRFSVASTAVPAPVVGQLDLGGVDAVIPSLRHGAGFVLFVNDGYLSMLEGFTFAEDLWPDSTAGFSVHVNELRAKSLERLNQAIRSQAR